MKLARPTSVLLVVSLLAIGVVVGRLAPPVIVRLDGTPPRLGWVAPLTLLGAALVVGGYAWNTWQSLHKKHERMTADHGIMMLSLAKSCAVVASLVAGLYGGFALAFVDNLDSMLGEERFVRGLAASVASLLLLIAALLLERACRLPEDDDEDGNTGSKAKGRPDPNPA
jgi:drug/metabolite transporter (DMT)-like permease